MGSLHREELMELLSISAADSTGVLDRYKAFIGDQKLDIPRADIESFTFHAILSPIQCVRDKNQAINTEKLPLFTSVEVAQMRYSTRMKSSQTLMHTMVLTLTLNSSMCRPLSRTRLPPQGLSWHMIEGFLRAHEGKVKGFVGGNVLATGEP